MGFVRNLTGLLNSRMSTTSDDIVAPAIDTIRTLIDEADEEKEGNDINAPLPVGKSVSPSALVSVDQILDSLVLALSVTDIIRSLVFLHASI